MTKATPSVDDRCRSAHIQKTSRAGPGCERPPPAIHLNDSLLDPHVPRGLKTRLVFAMVKRPLVPARHFESRLKSRRFRFMEQ